MHEFKPIQSFNYFAQMSLNFQKQDENMDYNNNMNMHVPNSI